MYRCSGRSYRFLPEQVRYFRVNAFPRVLNSTVIALVDDNLPDDWQHCILTGVTCCKPSDGTTGSCIVQRADSIRLLAHGRDGAPDPYSHHDDTADGGRRRDVAPLA